MVHGWVVRVLAIGAVGPGFKTVCTQDFSKALSLFTKLEMGMGKVKAPHLIHTHVSTH